MRSLQQCRSAPDRPWLARALGCGLFWVAMGTVWAQGVEELTKQGRAALGEGRYEQALELFAAALENNPDESVAQRLQFYNAVALQQLAREGSDGRKQEMLEEAARLYTVYLEANPDDNAANNNLAKVYEQLGWSDQAVELYEKAIASNDSRQGLYLQNYAKLLDQSGDWQQASDVYQRMVQEQPLSRSQQAAMARRYAERGLDDLANYLWELTDAGSSWQVADLALRALADSADQSAEPRVELLTIVCVALSRMPFDTAELEEMRQRLGELASDSSIGEGANEIARLHAVARRILRLSSEDVARDESPAVQRLHSALAPDHYEWWQRTGRPDEDPLRGVSPADGFRALIRSLGTSLKQAANASDDALRSRQYYSFAEQYYRLAADLQDWEVDPAAVRELVRLRVETNKLPEVEYVLEEYHDRLYRGKGNAIRNRQLEKIFEYHKTLGELYTQLGRWGDSSLVQSAVFQLEQARETSHEIEQQLGGELPQAYRFTPDMVDMLDQAYTARGHTGAGNQLRIEEAEHYKKQGDDQAAEKVLEPVREEQLPEDLRRRRDDISLAPSPKQIEAPPSPRIVDKASLTRSGSGEIRLFPGEDSRRKQLSPEQSSRVAAQLQKLLDSGATGYSAKMWEGAPGTFTSLQLHGRGRGTLTLELDGRIVEIPFEKVTGNSRVVAPNDLQE